MSEKYTADNGRPVEASHLEIADTFQDAGTRPIEESPDVLVSNSQNIEETKDKASLPCDINEEQNEINSVPPLD